VAESCWSLNRKSEDHFLSFPKPPQLHVSDAHSHSYGHFGTATCGVSGLLENWVIERVEAFGTFTDSGKIRTLFARY
jgi:hypothetical protein